MESNRVTMSLLKEWSALATSASTFLEKKIPKNGENYYIDIKLLGVSIGGFHFFSNPTYIKHVLFDNQLNYTKPDAVYKVFKKFSGEYGLLTTSSYERWHRDRTIWNPHMALDHLEQYTSAMVAEIKRSLDEWKEHEKNHTPMNLKHAVLKLSYDILQKTLFKGTTFDFYELEPHLTKILSVGTLDSTILGLTLKPSARRALKKHTKKLLEVGDELVRSSLESKEESNLINILAKGYENLDISPEEKHKSLRAECLNILVAGHETIASTLGQAFAYLSLSPIHARKIREEINTLVGDRDPVFEDIKKLAYTEACIKETTRLKAAFASVSREALADDSIGQYKINKGQLIVLSLYSIHRSPLYWKNPEGFEPERFLNVTDDRYKYTWIPFSLGPRNCIGQHFAMMQTVLVTAMITQRYYLYLTASSSLEQDEFSLLTSLNTEVEVTLHSQ